MSAISVAPISGHTPVNLTHGNGIVEFRNGLLLAAAGGGFAVGPVALARGET